jgi:hypothetical protein
MHISDGLPPSVKLTDGSFPRLEAVFDPSLARIDIFGIATFDQVLPGNLERNTYHWTLTFCRVTNDVPAC